MAWLAVALITTLPYLAARKTPDAPRFAGMRFSGAIAYVDDFYQYLSFAEQASRGAFLLSNKFDPEPQRPACRRRPRCCDRRGLAAQALEAQEIRRQQESCQLTGDVRA